MRAFVVALTIILAAALPAAAQGPGGRKHHGSEQKQTTPKKVDDKAYRDALGRLPDRKYDPWKDMR